MFASLKESFFMSCIANLILSLDHKFSVLTAVLVNCSMVLLLKVWGILYIIRQMSGKF